MYRHSSPIAVLTATLAGLLGVASAASAQSLTQPATAVFLTLDNSGSMDYTTELGVVPSFPATCDPANEEYARTRYVVAAEALTGSMVNYCPQEQTRDSTLGARDDGVLIPHTLATFDRQRQDGILDVYADTLYFGLGTFDAVMDASTSETGDFSYGSTYASVLNLGLANRGATVGGLVSPLPPGWVPDTPGSLTAFRLTNNARIQGTIRQVVPALGTPIAAALDDVQHFRQFDPGVRSDPFEACRPYVHVLVTDGQPQWDECYNSATPSAELNCGTYTGTYALSSDEAEDLALGESCTGCTAGQTVHPVPTYVVAFATDDPSSADAIAEAGGTCAIVSGTGDCVEHAFRAEAQAELVFALGTVFNRFVGGEISLIPPLTSTVAFEGDVGLVRYRASSQISQTSPYWTGRLSRELFTCRLPDGGEEGDPLELLPSATIEFSDQFTSSFVSERNIMTARLDIAEMGSSCLRPDCPIDDPLCFDSGARPDPVALSGFGDGTGGLDTGGTDPDALGLPESESSCTATQDANLFGYDDCAESCAEGDDDCICACEEFYGCGTCGYEPAPPDCSSVSKTACELVCMAEGGLLLEDCECFCEDLLNCGHCGHGRFDITLLDADDRGEVDDALDEERRLSDVRGNEDELPEPGASLDFDALEIDDSCLIPFSQATFVDDQDLSAFLYANNTVEAERMVQFARGENLAALETAGLLDGVFDPDLIDLHDRAADGYLGDFFHSTMGFLKRPTPRNRATPGYDAFVDAVGVGAETPRPYALFIGGNDGMLHAFDAITGSELWGIIPPSFLPQLGQSLVSHRNLVDGPVVVRDLLCSQTPDDEEWCSLLAVSYRSGGSGAMVLDVTDPTAPRFLFEVTGRQVHELGLGYPRPLLGNMLVDDEVRPVLVLAGGRPLEGPEVVVGFDLVGSHEGEVLALFDALTGELLRQFDPVSHPAVFAQCGSVTGSPSGWSPDLFTRIFAGTQRGCLLRVDTSDSDPLEWTLEILYQTDTPGEIRFAPALAPRSDGTLVIVFGHGDTDTLEQVNQSSNLVSINEDRGFVEGDEDTLGTFTLADNASVNWELALAQGEVLTAQPIVADGIVLAGTWVPNATDACGSGESHLYAIDFIGDTSVVGADATKPSLVTIDSDRIVARLPNAAFDPEDQSSEPFLKFLDGESLGADTVVFGINIESVPNCQTFEALEAGYNSPSSAAATERRLLVDLMGEEDTTSTTESAGGGSEPAGDTGGGETPTEPNAEDDMLTIINFEQSLPQAEITSIAVDWGVILDF